MKKAYVIAGVLIITLVSVFIFYDGEADSAPTAYDQNKFIGEWVAVEYFYTSNVQMTGADEYLGNKIYLRPDSFFSDYLDGFPAISVSGYLVEEQSTDDFYINYTIFPYEVGVEGDTLLKLHMINDGAYSGDVGIIVDEDTLICNTGSGWYLYKRVGTEALVESRQSQPDLTINADYARTLVIYDNFLLGGYGKRDENGEYTPAVAEGLKGLTWDGTGYVPFGDYPWTYALYDMNHDGIPELHVRPGSGHYTIYTYDKEFTYPYDGELHGPVVWADLSSSSFTVPLNNGATLGYRPGTYSGVAMNFYTYNVFDFFGNEQLRLSLEVYDLDDDNVLEYYLDRSGGDIEEYRLPKGLEEKIIEEVLLAKSDRIVWHGSNRDYVYESTLNTDREYTDVEQYEVEYEAPVSEPDASGLSENLRYPVMGKSYDVEIFVCPVMLMTGFGSIDDMKDSLLDDELYAAPALGDSDGDGKYDTLFTARKYNNVPDSMWYDNLLTKKEFLRAMDLLLQKTMDAELLNVRVNDGFVADYCKSGS
jgi:hypothetical protein